MIAGKQLFLAIRYLDPDRLPLNPPETEQEINEEDISQDEIFQAIHYLDPDLENAKDIESQGDKEIFRAIHCLDPDLDRQSTLFKLRWLPRKIWRVFCNGIRDPWA